MTHIIQTTLKCKLNYWRLPIQALLTALVIISSSTLVHADSHAEQSTVKVLNKPDKNSWTHWYNNYQNSYRSEDGWLSLIGLYWLKEGKNTLGSCAGNTHRLPKGTPCHLGNININSQKIVFDSQIALLIDGNKTQHSELAVNETQVNFGSYWFYIIEREKGYAVRMGNKQNPALKAFKGLPFFPFDPNAVVAAKLERPQTPMIVKIATVYGTVREVPVAGWLHFNWHNKPLKLLAVNYGAKEPMGLMFADETNQDTTYGAGRYLDVPWPDKAGNTWIDFNRGYNPPCAYTSFATCPLPPAENRLPVAIEAGAQYNSAITH